MTIKESLEETTLRKRITPKGILHSRFVYPDYRIKKEVLEKCQMKKVV